MDIQKIQNFFIEIHFHLEVVLVCSEIFICSTKYFQHNMNAFMFYFVKCEKHLLSLFMLCFTTVIFATSQKRNFIRK